MSGAIPLVHLYAFMACIRTTLPLTFTRCPLCSDAIYTSEIEFEFKCPNLDENFNFKLISRPGFDLVAPKLWFANPLGYAAFFRGFTIKDL
jgi:hypothetical protein